MPLAIAQVKPGNSEIVDPLMNLFQRHPALLSRVAVIMSFDAYLIEDIAERFAFSTFLRRTGGGGSKGDLVAIAEGIPRNKSSTVARRGRNSRMSKVRACAASVSYGNDAMGTCDAAGPIPKLLILTAHGNYDARHIVTNVNDGFEGLSDKLPKSIGIDGVYIEYQPEMLEPKGRENMLKLAEKHIVGVWMLKPRDPDSLSVATKLVEECGVTYVNTDFPRGFFSS